MNHKYKYSRSVEFNIKVEPDGKLRLVTTDASAAQGETLLDATASDFDALDLTTEIAEEIWLASRELAESLVIDLRDRVLAVDTSEAVSR